MAKLPDERPAKITLEHASGMINVLVDFEIDAAGITLKSAGLVRTARLIARGDVMIPRSILNGPAGASQS